MSKKWMWMNKEMIVRKLKNIKIKKIEYKPFLLYDLYKHYCVLLSVLWKCFCTHFKIFSYSVNVLLFIPSCLHDMIPCLRVLDCINVSTLLIINVARMTPQL